MHLKKLLLFGFKSFADKAELFFEPGVTTVVGPNGCGKSNISDSIRWVLGEENARKLRGERMDDLIFNGAGQRKSIGFAEVSLVFDNTTRKLPLDFSEVEITRKIYRSGESEYLINRTPCRLRDIRELLMDTGIGVDSYSVVGQGRMDRILSSKPDDRREVFEEAAGITKYKARKREALLKLNHTEENLQRVDDILQEVRRQIGSLGRQAEKAKQYEVKRHRLQELEIQQAAHELKRVREKGSHKKEEHEALVAEERELSRKIQEAEEALARARREFEEREAHFSSERVRMGQLTAERKSLEDRQVLNRERVGELQREEGALQREIELLKGRIQESADRIREEESLLRKEHEDQEARVKAQDAKKQQVAGIREETARQEKQIEAWKMTAMSLAGRMAHQRNDLARLTAELGTQQSRRRRIAQELENVEKERLEAGRIFKELQVEIKESRERIRAAREHFEELKKRRRDREEERARDHLEWVEAREEFSKIVSRREFLEQLEERHEGFHAGVREILAALGNHEPALAGVRGVLAELISVPRGAEGWVEKALGEDVQAIVCESREAAERVSRYLSERKAGRARFFSLDSRWPQSPGQSAEGWQSLLEGVQADDDVMPLVRVLLGRAWKGGTLQAAWARQAENASLGESWTTQSGEIVRASGCLEGGESEETPNRSLIGRSTQIEDLLLKQEDLERRLDKLTEREEAARRDIVQFTETERDAQKKAHDLEVQHANREGEVTRREQAVKQFEEEHGVLTLEVSEVLTEIEELEGRERVLKESLDEIAQEDRSLQALIFKTQEGMRNAQETREQFLVELAQIETELGSHQVRVTSRSDTLEKLKQHLSEQSSVVQTRLTRLTEVRDRQKELEGDNETLTGDLDKWGHEIRLLEGKIEEARQGRDQYQSEIDTRQAPVRELAVTQNDVRNRIRDFDVLEARARYEQDSLRDRILQAYDVDLYTAPPDIPEHFNLEKTRDDVARLKAYLDKMGEVNLVAIAEQKELQERLDFLTRQKEDLKEAKASIHQAINKINRTTRTLFLETFQRIQEYFLDYFTTLFGGGDAKLVLLDEKEVLESGIEILVKPPGKKLRNITLLSGGERAMTATALMFALFKVRPSPFCVLDEIDAPLDDANIGRFTRVLEDFTKDSQFIVITHNKKTIGIADCIYGVTMQESGVSKVVSIKLGRSSEQEKPDAQQEALVQE